MEEIQLTQGKVAIVDIINDELKHKWHANKMGNSFYAKRDIIENGKRKVIHMHRLIMEQKLGRKLKKNELVDHINKNGLDNRECNLRLCTKSQNRINSKRRNDNTSGYKGVNKHRNKWMTRIGEYSTKRLFLGQFDDPIEAAITYDRKAMELFGEFAQLNVLMVG
jgi:hypothetical protein